MALPLVFRPGAAETAFLAVLAAWLVFELVMRVRQRQLARGATGGDPTIFVLVACLAGAVIAAQALGRGGGLDWPGGLLWPVVAGAVLVITGGGLRAWSMLTLGRLFQFQIAIQPGHHVVTGGPYRFLRHPSYTAILLILTGVALACGDVWSLVAVLALGCTGLAVRIRAEERQLTEALGTEYTQFAATRKRLIPGMW